MVSDDTLRRSELVQFMFTENIFDGFSGFPIPGPDFRSPPYRRDALHSMVYLTDQMLSEHGTRIGNGYDFRMGLGLRSDQLDDDLTALAFNHDIGIIPGTVNGASDSARDSYFVSSVGYLNSKFFNDSRRLKRKLETAERGLHRKTRRMWKGMMQDPANAVESAGLAYYDRNGIDTPKHPDEPNAPISSFL